MSKSKSIFHKLKHIIYVTPCPWLEESLMKLDTLNAQNSAPGQMVPLLRSSDETSLTESVTKIPLTPDLTLVIEHTLPIDNQISIIDRSGGINISTIIYGVIAAGVLYYSYNLFKKLNQNTTEVESSNKDIDSLKVLGRNEYSKGSTSDYDNNE